MVCQPSREYFIFFGTTRLLCYTTTGHILYGIDFSMRGRAGGEEGGGEETNSNSTDEVREKALQLGKGILL
jgi:hypothetical protein